MDYTSVALVKEAMLGTESTEDALLARLVTAASRAIDRHCVGQDATDYFKTETLTDEEIWGQINNQGVLRCWPHKPLITGVSALSYRSRPFDTWTEVSTDKFATHGPLVEAWLSSSRITGRVFVKISYTGGMGAALGNLPADLVEAATLLAARFYKEASTGLSDSIGVAELGTLIYTKAWPVRVREMLKPFKRVTPW